MKNNINWKIIKEYPKCQEVHYDVDDPKPFDERLNKPLNKNGDIVEQKIDINKPLF